DGRLRLARGEAGQVHGVVGQPAEGVDGLQRLAARTKDERDGQLERGMGPARHRLAVGVRLPQRHGHGPIPSTVSNASRAFPSFESVGRRRKTSYPTRSTRSRTRIPPREKSRTSRRAAPRSRSARGSPRSKNSRVRAASNFISSRKRSFTSPRESSSS